MEYFSELLSPQILTYILRKQLQLARTHNVKFHSYLRD